MDKDKYRTEAREKIIMILAENIPEDEAVCNGKYLDIDTVATTIEKGINNYAISHAKNQNIITNWKSYEFVGIYDAQLQTILHNLACSAPLLELIKSGDYNIGALSPQYLNPNANKKIRDEIASRNAVDIEYKVSDRHTCRKCKQARTTIRDYQARGSDEPRTIVAECLSCGFKWNIQ